MQKYIISETTKGQPFNNSLNCWLTINPRCNNRSMFKVNTRWTTNSTELFKQAKLNHTTATKRRTISNWNNLNSLGNKVEIVLFRNEKCYLFSFFASGLMKSLVQILFVDFCLTFEKWIYPADALNAWLSRIAVYGSKTIVV